jgi:type I restriction enzyme S subunit
MELRDGYKRTEVGVIPEDWGSRKLGELATFRTGPFGSALHKSDYTSNGIPIVNPMHIVDGEIVPTQSMTITEAAATALSEFRLKVGEVVIGRRGDMGRCAVVRSEHSGWLCGTGSMIVRPSAGIETRFLQRVLSSPSVISAIEDTSVGSTMINLNQATLGGLTIQVPPTVEQRAIATALSDVDALLAKIDQLIAKKRDLKQATMQQLLTGQTRLPGFSGEWEVKRLGDLAETGSGGTPPSSVTAYYDGDIPWVSIADMTSGGKVIFATERNLAPQGLKNSAAQMFPVGTVLYAMYASIGECSIAGVPLCSSQAILGIRTKAMLDRDFLFYHLTSLKPIIKTMGQQGTQANLNAGMVRAFEIMLPKLPEQTGIATVLSDMDTELSALEARRDKTRALKQGMMQALLTGRIRLVGAN